MPTPTKTSSGAMASYQAISALRIRFTSEPSASAKVRRRFTQPHPAVAIEEPAEVEALLAEGPSSGPTDQLSVIIGPQGGPPELRKQLEQWLTSSEKSESRPITTVDLDGGRIQWTPGRAVIQGPINHSKKLLVALIDFAFFEGELRKLEQALDPFESQAPGDVALAYRISTRDKGQWDRLAQTMENLSQMRLTLARLEPNLYTVPRTLPTEARRAMFRLLSRADIEDRLEAMSDRLEACEDLYEGAVDRITDFRWYRKSNAIEIAIVVILVLEAVVLVCDFYRHH